MRRIAFAFVLALLFHPLSGQTPGHSPADRSTALNTLFHEIWEDSLKRSPEFASALGDRHYNDQLSDLSARAFNDRLAVEQAFLNRLLIIDSKGLSEQDRTSADLMQRELIQDQETASLKPWQLPINQTHNVAASLPAQLAFAPFATVKDYDDYIARLHLIPALLRQVSEDLLAGIDDHRVQPAAMLQQALTQTESLASQTPADSSFAAPLADFPATIGAAERKRIVSAVLDAIETDVLPAYVRFGKFLRAAELPAASPQQTEPQPYKPSGDQLRRTKVVGLLIKAEAAPNFDLKAFRDLIAANSAVPLDTLEQRVDAWIATKQ